MQRPALCSSARQIKKQKASIRFAITACHIYIDSLSQTQNGDKLEKEIVIMRIKKKSWDCALITPRGNIANIWCMSLNKAAAQSQI